MMYEVADLFEGKDSATGRHGISCSLCPCRCRLLYVLLSRQLLVAGSPVKENAGAGAGGKLNFKAYRCHHSEEDPEGHDDTKIAPYDPMGSGVLCVNVGLAVNDGGSRWCAGDRAPTIGAITVSTAVWYELRLYACHVPIANLTSQQCLEGVVRRIDPTDPTEPHMHFSERNQISWKQSASLIRQHNHLAASLPAYTIMTMIVHPAICEASPKCLHQAPIIRNSDVKLKNVARRITHIEKNFPASNWKWTMK